jgi:hypothetical protein
MLLMPEVERERRFASIPTDASSQPQRKSPYLKGSSRGLAIRYREVSQLTPVVLPSACVRASGRRGAR